MARPLSHRRVLVAHPGAELYGSDRVMLESVIGMVGAGAEVTVTLPDDGALADPLREAGARVVIAPAFVVRKSMLRPANWASAVRLTVRGWRTARRLLARVRPHVVYISTVTLPLWPAAARISGVPAVLHLHEAEQDAPRLLKKLLYSPAGLVSDVIVNSEFSRRVLGDSYASRADDAVVVYNGVVGPTRRVPSRPVLTPPVRLVFVGRLSERKGPDLVVEALSLLPRDLPEVHLAIVGAVFAGYEWYEERLRARIIELGLERRVHMLGFRDDVWGAVADADMMIVPSRMDEPFGNTAVEAVLAERLVLVSDTSGLREATAGVRTAIRFEPRDAQAIADAVANGIRRWEKLQPSLAADADAAAERYEPERYRAAIAQRLEMLASTPRAAGRRRSRASRGTT